MPLDKSHNLQPVRLYFQLNTNRKIALRFYRRPVNRNRLGVSSEVSKREAQVDELEMDGGLFGAEDCGGVDELDLSGGARDSFSVLVKVVTVHGFAGSALYCTQ